MTSDKERPGLRANGTGPKQAKTQPPKPTPAYTPAQLAPHAEGGAR